MEYRLSGQGPVVVVLKGGHCSRATRLGHERLAEHGFTLLEPSRPGYDRTPAAVGCTAQVAADAIAELLDVLAIERAGLVAISGAGHTGIELARRHAARIDRISFESAVALPYNARTRRGGRVLFGPLQAPVWWSVRAGLRLAPSRTLGLLLSPLTTLDAVRLVRDMDPDTRRQYLEAFASLWSGTGFACDLGHDSPSAARIAQPALIMRSVHDPSLPGAHADRLQALCSHHERVDLDAETHFIWFDRSADEVWARRLAFFAGSPPAQSAGDTARRVPGGSGPEGGRS
jgi:pimeloyl-ACP methyl ester carboxylesterase